MGTSGLRVLDVSQIQAREPLPVVQEVGRVSWTEGALAQHTVPVTWGGKPHVVFVEEGGQDSSFAGPAGGARLIDVADPADPVVVSRITLEIHQPERAERNQEQIQGNGLFGYRAHYCTVDRPADPTALACSFFQSGIRVFDVRDPEQPREIAYFNPPAQADKKGQLPGSEHAGSLVNAHVGGVGVTPGIASNLTTDWCTSQIRFVTAADGERQLWTQCQDNGFLALQFSPGTFPVSAAPGRGDAPAAGVSTRPAAAQAPAGGGLPSTGVTGVLTLLGIGALGAAALLSLRR